jgi:hypothetical protein
MRHGRVTVLSEAYYIPSSSHGVGKTKKISVGILIAPVIMRKGQA